MLYRHKRTGAVIETDCTISGDWEPATVPSEPEKTDDAPVKQKKTASKGKTK